MWTQCLRKPFGRSGDPVTKGEAVKALINEGGYSEDEARGLLEDMGYGVYEDSELIPDLM